MLNRLITVRLKSQKPIYGIQVVFGVRRTYQWGTQTLKEKERKAKDHESETISVGLAAKVSLLISWVALLS